MKCWIVKQGEFFFLVEKGGSSVYSSDGDKAIRFTSEKAANEEGKKAPGDFTVHAVEI